MKQFKHILCVGTANSIYIVRSLEKGSELNVDY